MVTARAIKVRINTANPKGFSEANGIEDALRKVTGIDNFSFSYASFKEDSTIKEGFSKAIEGADIAFEMALKAIEAQFPEESNRISEMRINNQLLLQKANSSLKAKGEGASLKDIKKIYVDYLLSLENLLDRNFPQYKGKNLLNAGGVYDVLNKEKPILASIRPIKNKQGQTEYKVEMEVPQKPFNDEVISQILKARPDHPNPPLWYKGMPPEEKLLFDFTMKSKGIQTKADVIKHFDAISSRHRIIPGVANFSEHVTAIIKADGTVEKLPSRFRSSMISSRDIKKLNLSKAEKKQLSKEYAVNNLKHIMATFIKNQLMEEFNNVEKRKKFQKNPDEPNGALDPAKVQEYLNNLPFLIQTLITPQIPGKPDSQLYKDKQLAIEELRNTNIDIKIGDEHFQFAPKIIDTNHSANFMRHFIPTGSIYQKGPTKKEVMDLIDLANRWTQKNLVQDPILNQLVHDGAADLKELVNNPPGAISSIMKSSGRELHISALEEMLVTRMNGLSYGSCVSGKDRKGIETMYADAMEEYFRKFGTLPKLDDTKENRKEFIEIFADIYLSNHQQLNAGQNAMGADGIKTPGQYLPKDIKKRIIEKSGNKDIFKESSKLANNNDPGKLIDEAHDEMKHAKKHASQAANAKSTKWLYGEMFKDTNGIPPPDKKTGDDRHLSSEEHKAPEPKIEPIAKPEVEKKEEVAVTFTLRR